MTMIYSFNRKNLCLIAIISCLSISLTGQIAFQETSFSNAQLIIEEEQLPYIIYFYSSWCPSCQLMEEMTFKNQRVNKRIEKNYVVFKVNADSERGKEWMATYQVTTVPTTLFYNKDGYLLNRLTSSITANNFLKITADLGVLSPNEKSAWHNNSLTVKNNIPAVQLAKERKINSAPKNDLSTTIAAINIEIEGLKVLSEKITGNTLPTSSKADKLTAKGGNKSTTPISYPSVEKITTQIEACKALLTGPKNIQRLINILEDYKVLLAANQGKEATKKDMIIPASYQAPTKKVVTRKTTTYQKKYAYNQQIIRHLKLTPPIKKGNQFIVQLGKYQNIRNVERLVQHIQDKYDYPIKIHIQQKGDVPVQIVYLGEFKTEAEAIAANENLKWIDRKGVVRQF